MNFQFVQRLFLPPLMGGGVELLNSKINTYEKSLKKLLTMYDKFIYNKSVR
ncbi:hypothetical protein UT300012_33110 [Paraclostridium bifermentans]